MTGSALRIGLVVPRFAPFHGGVETMTAEAAAALAANGAEVTVVTQVPRGARLLARDVHDGYIIERHYLPFGETFDVPSLAAARAACRSRRFDVVWVHNYHTPLVWLAAEQAKTPVVVTPHYHGVGHTPLRQALHMVYRPAGRRLMAASRRIVVDSPPDTPDPVATSLYADAMARFLHSPGGCRQRAARCALSRAAEVADRLFRTLTSVIE